MITFKSALMAPAFAAIALSTTVTVALADPESTPASPSGNEVRQTPATVTVTATVAPGQCMPIAGGPSSVSVTDTAGAPTDTQGAPLPTTVTTVARTEGEPGTGASTSRFDPYTCAPVPAVAATEPGHTAESAPSLAPTTVAAVPSYTAPLAPYPGSNGAGIASGGDAVAAATQQPLSSPTTITTVPAPAALAPR
ncbi:hypothetical protein [Mycolicibacterium aubagnense]|uniref:hypothetical protein n=1 Tax=Mycolicibacterium aubagnense TaxID=319707 RepID=UPI001F32315A|nr:hypothetical protein [Mycolicibacterium aubagnense]